MLIHLESRTDVPLYRQVYNAIREAIMAKKLPPNQRLPPSREMAKQLSLSRNTINTAYSQLCAEGYLVSRPGSGYFVGPDLPAQVSTVPRRLPASSESSAVKCFSRRGAYLVRPTRPVPRTSNPAFQPGLPDVAELPLAQWRQCLNHVLKTGDNNLLKYSDTGGYAPLKHALGDYLSQARGVNCTSGQIVIVNGSQAGLDLIARLLIDPGDVIAVEEPGYLGARDAFLAAGAKLQAITVDADGMQVQKLARLKRPVQLVYTTPSYQFPLGATLSLPRRMELLAWAKQHNAFIIEDDYDSEFRYRDRPLACLQGLDGSGRVFYFGTFSKVLFPGLRMGYLVVPQTLADAFAKALRKTGQDAPLQLQAALARFIEQGFFIQHIRRMRTLYGKKQQLLLSLLQSHVSEWLTVEATSAGMQLPVFFRQAVNLDLLTQLSQSLGITLSPLQNYYLTKRQRPGLYLGYAGVPIPEMKQNVLTLRKVLQQASHTA